MPWLSGPPVPRASLAHSGSVCCRAQGTELAAAVSAVNRLPRQLHRESAKLFLCLEYSSESFFFREMGYMMCFILK